MVMDATGAGDPVCDDLRPELPDIEGFVFTAQSKAEIVQRLAVAIEQRRVSWPGGRPAAGGGDWEILTAELKRYEYEIGPAGRVTYGAPAGFHDDCVMALALANHARWRSQNGGGTAARLGSRWMDSARRRKREQGILA